MARWKWASLGVAMWLGTVGCGSGPEANGGPSVDGPPEEVAPVGVEPSLPGSSPLEPEAVSPPPTEAEVPPPSHQEALCPALDLGRMPDEGLLEDRPSEFFCGLSPDACDALRSGHARRAVPRPCRVWSTTPYSSQDFRLEHDALGRLDSFESPPDWYEAFSYDACHRLVAHDKTPAWSMANFDDAWTRAEDGQLLRWTRGSFSALTETVMERDAQGRLLGATTTWSHSGFSGTTLTQQYTLDARGRILSAEGMSPDAEKGLQFREERVYDSETGALTEVIRRSATGTQQSLKAFSGGRMVRYVTATGTEQRWAYSADGVLQRYEELPSAGSAQSLRSEFQYGEDGRLLRVLRTKQVGADVEPSSVSEYRYADDGRILRREDLSGPGNPVMTTYEYDYVCEPDGR